MKKIREFLNKQLKENEKGFTLIELMVVVVILGILAAVVIPKVSGSSAKAKDAADKANIATIEAAAERYYVENEDNYPTSVQVLVDKGYLKSAPKNPNNTDKGYKIDTADGEVTHE